MNIGSIVCVPSGRNNFEIGVVENIIAYPSGGVWIMVVQIDEVPLSGYTAYYLRHFEKEEVFYIGEL